MYTADTPDEELITAYVGGASAAFDEIVNRYEGRVYAVALRMTANREDARDVTQDVFISAMRALRTFRGDAKLTTWFHRVTVNAALDLSRKRKRRPTAPLEVVREAPSTEAGPDEHADAASRAAEVQRALSELSADHRAVLVLHDLQDMDYAQVAEALGIPRGTVKSRIHRARTELAKRLGHLRTTEPNGADEPLS